MAKTTTSYRCTSCGATHMRWLGKCPKCGEFGTVEETTAAAAVGPGVKATAKSTSMTPSRKARRVNDIDTGAHRHTPTGINELDRVLGGGLVAGQAILIFGEPGVGKSTLLMAAAHAYADTGKTVLYCSAEESAEQITLRARRLGANANTLFIADETDLAMLLGHIDEVQPDLVIVDSVQTIASGDVDGRAGGVAQVMEVATVLTRVAKSRRIPMILVGQVTKSLEAGGPAALAHLVDTTLSFTGDTHTNLRLLQAFKNRYGAVGDLAAFEHTETGLVEVPDASALFRSQREEAVPGVCVTVAMEGRRALLAEVQALVAPTNAPNPRRGVSGLDTARAAMLVAVTERHGRIRLFDKDSFLATVAGMRLTEPAADLAVCLALASAAWDAPLPIDVAAIGEVALSGDIRPVGQMPQRIAEAARLGFRRILVPAGVKKPAGVEDVVLIPVSHVRAAFTALRGFGPVSEGE